MKQKDGNDHSDILDSVIRYIFILGEKGRYRVSIYPEDCSVQISVPGKFVIRDNIATIEERYELYRGFDSMFFDELKELLGKHEYRKMVIRLCSRKQFN
jgi:hypothetical protein